MPRRKAETRTKLRAVEGGLSIYREGDPVTVAVEGVELDAVVQSAYAHDGGLWLDVDTTMAVSARIVKRGHGRDAA